MSDRISIDGDGLIFTADEKESEYFYIEDTEFFGHDEDGQWNGKQYPHANVLGPGQRVKHIQIDGALLVGLRCLAAEFAIGILVLGWLIWKTH